VDAAVLTKEIDAVSKAARDEAFRRYQSDPRDTATPVGMATLLGALADGTLLSERSTKHLLDVMAATVTFPDRLKAGLAKGWTLGHKTGTSGTWKSVTAAANDVGILTAPDGQHISVVVFIADSRAPAKDRAALMARIASAAIARYRK
jgi:beta-lactamase class A